MLELAILISVFEFIDYLLSGGLRRKLKNEPSSKKRVVIRQRVRLIRKIMLDGFAVFVVACVLLNFVVAVLTDSYWGLICMLAVTFVYFVILKKWERLRGRLSTLEMESGEWELWDYSLFLRGFSSDDYESIDKLELKSDDSFDGLSEYWFFKILSRADRRPVVSIGMPREVESPYGTQRVYLDDNTWNDDVKKLMQHAGMIYILVHDSESCVWEILQTRTLIEKTVFIADNQQKYDMVRGLIGSHIHLPPIDLANGRCAAISFTPEPVIKYFVNTPQGYADLVNVEFTGFDKVENRAVIGCIAIIGILAILWLIGKMVFLPDLSNT